MLEPNFPNKREMDTRSSDREGNKNIRVFVMRESSLSLTLSSSWRLNGGFSIA